jgi:hypothetical protein
MKLISIQTITILGICLLSSCNYNKSPFYDELFTSETGHLRGANIGAKIEAIHPLENDSFLIESTPNYLHYEYEMSKGNSYTIRYHFSDNNELYAIEMAVFLAKKEDVGLLYKKFSTHFNRKYSIGNTKEKGYITWQTQTITPIRRVAIALINDSDSYGYLTLLITDLDY